MAAWQPRQHVIEADLAHLRGAREFAADAAADFGLGVDACHSVKIAMSEAVTNAIRHGSSSPADRVHIQVTAMADTLVFEVVDTGRFRPRIAREGDMPERGRGLDFMRVLMDEVHVQPGSDGTRVSFAISRQAEEGAPASTTSAAERDDPL
jgi:serine/threonine-protein kinase RsbW